MKNPQIGFLSPDNQLDFMEYEDIQDFCKNLCEKEPNQERFIEFQKDYHYFEPYFDFVMFELDYIMINGLYRNRCITKYNNALYEILDSEELMDDNYSTLKPSSIDGYEPIPIMSRCSDSIMRVHSFQDNSNSCMITPQGLCMMSFINTKEDSGEHAITSRTILNQLLITNSLIANDYLQYSSQDACRYLVENLGFLRMASKKDGGIIIGNTKAMNSKLKDLIPFLSEYDFLDSAEEEMIPSTIERRK